MYIDGYHNKASNQILIVERDETGTRKFQMFPADYVFYYDDKKGLDRTMYGKACTKYTAKSEKQFKKELAKAKATGKVYESDIQSLYRCIENNYKGQPTPKLHTVFFDIEVDFHNEKGFAPPEDPFNKITAISLYLDWQDRLVTLVIKPDNISEEQAKSICDEFDNTYLCDTEEDILTIFIDLIEDGDILTGWNSEGFDIPYIIGRTLMILGKEWVKKFCHWNLMPKERTFERFGKTNKTYDLFGRVHLDYLQLYRKYTYHEMHSYSLDAISEYELNERKVAFAGSLDELYKFNFKKFVEYSRQDTMLLWKLEEKLKFISLTNQLAHENEVLLRDTLGAVKLTDQAIISETHERGFIVHDRDYRPSGWDDEAYPHNESTSNINPANSNEDEYVRQIDNTIAGAYVADPKKGIHEWIGSVDIVSLYPSIIRALNISPETIVGQLNQDKTKMMLFEKMKSGMTFTEAWAGVFSSLESDTVFDRDKSAKVTIEFEDDKELKYDGQEAYQLIFQESENLCMSANGTIFRTDQDGVIPVLLTKWFFMRKEMQKKVTDIETQLLDVDDLDKMKQLEQDLAFWDQRQLIKKIQLNSLYGALANPGSRFFDLRMAQSITLTGRNITRHMAAKINEILTAKYDYVGDCIIYGDTDSAYFSVVPIAEKIEGFDFTKQNIIDLYDQIGINVNESFESFMVDRFGCDIDKAQVIRCNREICATSALFVKKKRYAVLVYDKEGFRQDIDGKPGKLKITGMETQRSDTPDFVQDFLKEVLMKTLVENDEEKVITFIKDFRSEFQAMEPWKMGTPKRCNNMTMYTKQMDAIDRSGKKIYSNPRLPGHIRAAYNWNKYKIAFGDNRSMTISDGGKTIYCKLKNSPLGITSIAYPIDENNIPQWFKDLPFDKDLMEFTLIDKKIDNLIGNLKWDLSKSKTNPVLDELFTLE